MSVANDRYSLWKLGITHVLNAAHGKMHCQGSHNFYGSSVEYYGVPADDSPSFDLSHYFFPSAEYIQSALDTAGARVFVHCAVGVSRSASLVLAYLMIHQNYTLLEAINKVKEHRWIFPNTGFLKQLRALDMKTRKSAVAQNKTSLQKLGITHVLNAAHSKRGSVGNQSFYGNDFVYCGIPADDSTHFDLDVYFNPAADFIHKALKTHDGKVLVHCIMGMSRSSTLVLAYLMIYHQLPLKRALQKLIQKRAIYPNRNFLALLLDLDLQLTRKEKTCQILNIGKLTYKKHKNVAGYITKENADSCAVDLHVALAERHWRAAFPAKTRHIQKAKEGSVIHKNHQEEARRRYAAKDKRKLLAHHITHVLNAADGKFNVNTGHSFYRDTKITYHGVVAFDMPYFDLSPFFYPAANFIKNALSSPTGKVFVHCAMGLSRSSTLVLAYLIIHENMTLVDAIKAVSANRHISPNNGFLEQLRELDKKLHYQGPVRSSSAYGRT
ncbi:uncharacterized protein [Notothenia coriiceps]|uniref:Uncharacterized protein n=1 Tax=Notothenia coriiceps TaxID=8208 RepID=A0A6I9MZ03_9TELE|nr:PREDICTED: uncharacterized protein LOC104943471 [Notothenia coriiceps]